MAALRGMVGDVCGVPSVSLWRRYCGLLTSHIHGFVVGVFIPALQSSLLLEIFLGRGANRKPPLNY